MTQFTTTTATTSTGQVKNVIVMIADGAGFNTLEATRQYLANLPEGDPRHGLVDGLVVDGEGFVSTAQSTYPLSTRSSPVAGEAGLQQDPNTVYDPAKNYDLDPVAGNTSSGYPRGFDGYEWNRATAPDSANTASSIFNGEKSYNNAINVDGNGNPLFTLAELAHEIGKTVGVVSTVQISDATPAAGGGAHNASRANRTDIAQEMFAKGILDVIAGSGNPDYNDNGQLLNTPNNTWIGNELWNALKAGTFESEDGVSWNLLQDRADIVAAIDAAPSEQRLAMIIESFTGANSYRSSPDPVNEDPFTIPRLETSPTLTELSLAALNKLNQNAGAGADGLVVTIEGGEVDRAMHSNYFGRMIEEYISFNDAVKSVMDWVSSEESLATWDDTLLIVTADHDHLLFGPDGETVPYQPVQPDADGDLVPEYQWFGNGHSNQLVPLYAYGAGSTGVLELADQVDTATTATGETVGSGRNYTDQAELGNYLQELVSGGGTKGSDRALGSNAGDVIHGLAGDDALIGNGGDDQLFGGVGNDRLLGKAGADTMTGGVGDDGYEVDDAGDVVVELAGEGYDRVTALIDYTLGANVEKLMLAGTAIRGTGNELGNRIIGNELGNVLSGGAGDDALLSGAGNDTLIGGTGSNRLFGEDGADTFVFDAPGGRGNLTRLMDFVSGEDRIELVGTVFTALGGEGQLSAASFGLGRTATTAEQHVLYDQASGDFLYDADGLGGAAAVRIGTLVAGTALTAQDVWVA
ncbi:alkaline phosphatase [Pararoseomonas sp. SCSIO 73927]|uniref:alkaline phosphatase n=1 Tax=Pararoseomonas sp. SCSIO 73927 TaxID=3114537 RepID=UPI0030CF86AD